MNQDDRICGKVAAVLNSRELVINAGENKRVEEGMYFQVLADVDEEIIDPDTGDSLGTVEFKKVKIKITDVKQNLAIGRTYKKHRRNIGGTGSGLFSLDLSRLQPPKWITEYETLKLSSTSIEPLNESDSIVSVGDRVVQIIDDDDE